MIPFAETISMTTFLAQVLNELEAGHGGPVIPEAKRVYFQRRLRDQFFDFLRGRFEREELNGLTQAKLARRIGKSPEVISRWLSASSNLTLDSISDLMIGISAEEPVFDGKSLLNRGEANYTHLDELEDVVSAQAPRPKPDEDKRASALAEARKGFQQGSSLQDETTRRSLARDNAYYDRRRVANG
jgi:transcriptional regulator with XRE-family HTH domain